jgi:phage host-nuclease inhibitor protein Gam
MAKVKKKVISNVTLEQAQIASEQFAAAANALDKIQANMGAEMTKIRSKYQADINTHTEAQKEPYEVLSAYGAEQRDKWEGKSTKLLHCTIGFRMGPNKVDKKKGFTWESVIELLKKFKTLKQYVRSKEDVNKEAILQIKDEKILRELKDKAFIEIIKDEQFYATTKTEELATA